MKLSILIPVYNEEKTIVTVLKKITDLKLKHEKEIIIIDDGSTDKTAREIDKFRPAIRNVITSSVNKGKGDAIRKGIAKATGDYILIQDADLEYNPEEIAQLTSVLPGKKISSSYRIAVYGTRFKSKNVEIPGLYFMGNKILTFLTNILFRSRLSDMETGYKIIPVSFLRKVQLKSDHFDIEPEITAKLIKAGIRIIEVPIKYKGRSHSAGKKLTLRDAIGALKALIYFRFFD